MGALALALATIAGLKVETLLHARVATYVRGSPMPAIVMVVIDLVLTALLFTGLRRLALAGVMLPAVGGVWLEAVRQWGGGNIPSCGCVGTVRLSPWQHVALAAALFLLPADAARTAGGAKLCFRRSNRLRAHALPP